MTVQILQHKRQSAGEGPSLALQACAADSCTVI